MIRSGGEWEAERANVPSLEELDGSFAEICGKQLVSDILIRHGINGCMKIYLTTIVLSPSCDFLSDLSSHTML